MAGEMGWATSVEPEEPRIIRMHQNDNFTTGRGTPYGLAAVPVIKVATRSELAQGWHDLMDVDAGRIATGDATIEEVGWELFHTMLDVASGRRRPWTENWKLARG